MAWIEKVFEADVDIDYSQEYGSSFYVSIAEVSDWLNELEKDDEILDLHLVRLGNYTAGYTTKAFVLAVVKVKDRGEK